MSDLIDRQAAIDRINKQREHLRPDIYEQDYIGDAAYKTCAEFIGRLPSVQPEIIRCKDCKHYVLHVLFGRSQGWCERLCDEFDKSLARGTEDDDFCSRAERR